VTGPAPAAGKPKQRRRWSFVLTALLLGLVLALVLLEGAFRLFWQLPPWLAEFQQAGMYTAGADGQPVLLPGYRGTLRIGTDGPATQVAIGNLGMRGPDYGPKAAGEKRLLLVGDSLVFGYGVEGDEALPACVERSLEAEGVAVTVGNGGVPGFGSRHYALHLDRLDAPFAPDAFVVCGYLGNDAVDDATLQPTVYAGLMLHGAMAKLVHTSWRARLALRSRAALWLENWIVTNKPEWSPLATAVPDPEELARAAGLPPALPVNTQLAGLFLDVRDANKTWQEGTPPVIPRLLGYLEQSLQQMQVLAGDRPLVFVILPTEWHVDARSWREQLVAFGFDPKDYEFGLSQQRWREVAERLGIATLDATPVLAAAGVPAKELFIADRGHLSVRGNEVVGRWLAGELAARLR
jgi:lysophospholipase L1-like esterase